jgi:hypothetical protein
MTLYIYAQSGHNQNLDRVRRASVVTNILKEFEPILCTCDYRASMYARAELGVRDATSVDTIANMPNTMERGDILVYDSDEPTPLMKESIKDFCSLSYEIGLDIPKDIISDEFFQQHQTPMYEKAIFFGDDDYSKLILQMTKEKIDLPLLMGHYFFLGYEKELAPIFDTLIEEEEYTQTIQRTTYLLTGSINACIESLASGNNPVFFEREDTNYDDAIELISKYNIPTIKANTLEEIISQFDQIIKNYPQTTKPQKVDISSVKEAIKARFDLMKSLEV